MADSLRADCGFRYCAAGYGMGCAGIVAAAIREAEMSNLKPIHLFWSPLSHRIYATRAYKEVRKADGGTYVEVTGEKFDVTDQIESILIHNEVKFSSETIVTVWKAENPRGTQ